MNSYEIDIDWFNKLDGDSKLKVLKSDFRYFVCLVWDFLPDVNGVPTKIQLDIAYFLQHSTNRRMIQAYRGLGKTYLTGSYVVWRLWNNPNLNFILVSATSNFAIGIGRFIKNIIANMPIVQHMNPAKTNLNNALEFDVFGKQMGNKSPSVKMGSISGQITGLRADEIIADDVEIEKNSRSQTQRDSIIKGIKEFTNIIKPKIGKITYLGTPQTEDSIYRDLPNKGYEVKVWPARYPMLDKLDSYKDLLAEWIYEDLLDKEELQWQPLNPNQHDEKDLVERELDSGKSNFLLQYMLDTELTDAERFPLKLSDLIVHDCDVDEAPLKIQWGSSKNLLLDLPNVGFSGDRYYSPMHYSNDFHEYDGSVMSIDPSGRGADETSYAIIKALNGKLFVLEVGGLSGGYDNDTLVKLALIAKRNKVNNIIIESNFGDGMYTANFRSVLSSIHNCMVEEFRATTQKELRIINTLEPLMNRHKLIMDTKVIRDDAKVEDTNKSLFYQMTRITKDKGCLKHDDRLDALAIAIHYFIQHLDINEEDNIQSYKNEIKNKEFDEIMKLFGEDNPNSGNNILQSSGYKLFS